ncbi:MAG: hypothetical protein KatS3mg105_2428 [Gemmatales bacterium]|nr:MAG: hypothetical protein KatS3mg105_2428 [Gemmatales bacterium]
MMGRLLGGLVVLWFVLVPVTGAEKPATRTPLEALKTV